MQLTQPQHPKQALCSPPVRPQPQQHCRHTSTMSTTHIIRQPPQLRLSFSCHRRHSRLRQYKLTMESGHRYEFRTMFEGTICVGSEVLTAVLLRLHLPGGCALLGLQFLTFQRVMWPSCLGMSRPRRNDLFLLRCYYIVLSL